LESLKSLEIIGIRLTQDNIEDISTLTNLETLKFEIASFDKCNDFKPLNQLKNLKNLEINKSKSSVPSELVNAIKSIEKLVVMDSGEVNIEDLPNLSQLSYDEGNLSSLKNLNNLRNIYLTYFSGGCYDDNDMTSLENFNQITDLTISFTKLLPDAAGLSFCSPLKFKFSEDNQLKNLNIYNGYPSESSIEEILKLKHLENLDASCGGYVEEDGRQLLERLNSEFSSYCKR